MSISGDVIIPISFSESLYMVALALTLQIPFTVTRGDSNKRFDLLPLFSADSRQGRSQHYIR